MAESDFDDERVSVRTYVPAYQRDLWDEHAEDLGMSRSEYVRTMVQAGRNGFLEKTDPDETETATTPSSDDYPHPSSGETDLEDQVLDALAEEGYLSWDELLDSVTEDIERRLETTLQGLQSEGRVQYSGRNGGYTVDE